MIRSISYSRYFRMPMPMPSGSAVNPRISTSHSAELVARPARPAPQTAAPLISHFNCWRRSPDERRQLAICRISAASQSSATEAMNADHLAGHRKQPAQREQREEHGLHHAEPGVRPGGAAQGYQVPGGVHPDVVPG